MVDCLILAAGKGSRLIEMSGELPKSLVPLTSTIRNTLFLLIEQMSGGKFQHISIVGGYKYNILESHVNDFVAKFEDHQIPVTLVDAQQDWEKGILFSFLSYAPKNTTLVVPGDTIFSIDLVKGIFDAISGDLEGEVCLFYIKSPANPELSSFILEISSEGNVIGIKSTHNRVFLDSEETLQNFLFPIAMISPKFSDLCRKEIDISALGHEPSIFGAIQQYLRSGKKISAREIEVNDSFFRDIDTPTHLESVKKILSGYPERFVTL